MAHVVLIRYWCLTVWRWCFQVEDELDEISNQEFERLEKSLDKDK